MSDRRSLLTGGLVKPGPDLARQWRQVRFNPLRTVTPASLARDLDAFESGQIRNAALLWEAIEQRDDVAATVISKRKKAASRRPYDIVLTEDTDEAQAHKEALERFFNHLTVRDALDLNQRGGFALLRRQMMDAQMKGYAVHEIVWQPGEELRAELRFVPLYLFENTTGRLRYTGATGLTEGQALEEDGWMITCGDALMKAISVAWMFKRLSLTDWLNFSEKFGLPGIHGVTNAAKDSPEWTSFVDALEEFANDWVVATAQGTEIKLIESGKTGDAPFEPMVERMDRAIARLVRGEDLSTMSRGGGNDSTGASVQGNERLLLEADDCELLSETLNVQLCRQVIAHTFGEDVEPLAYLQIQPPKEQDTNADIAVDKHLESLGVPLAVADVAERYGRTLPDEDEELVGKPKAEGQPKAEGGRRKAEGEEGKTDDGLANVGTSEGARKGWETRRRGASSADATEAEDVLFTQFATGDVIDLGQGDGFQKVTHAGPLGDNWGQWAGWHDVTTSRGRMALRPDLAAARKVKRRSGKPAAFEFDEATGTGTIRDGAHSREFRVGRAKYAKGMHTLTMGASATGMKDRGARLASALKMRWSNREHAYIASPGKIAKWKRLAAEGWDTDGFNVELVPPMVEAENEAPTGGSSTDTLRAAIQEDLQPLRTALAETLQARGDADFRTALEQLTEHWDRITDAVLDGDSAEKALEDALGAAFVEGLDVRSLVAQNFEATQA